MVTGLDLVEWQLRVAAGEPLPLAQQQITLSGHAIEARLYAEDPERGFLPSTGTLAHLRLPASSEAIRIETGVTAGDRVSPFYDPMLAKIIAWGPDRAAALRRLRAALGETEIVGPATNLEFLVRAADHDAFRVGAVATAFVEDNAGELLTPPAPPDDRALAIACLWLLCRQRRTISRCGRVQRRSALALASGRRLAAERCRPSDLAFARRRRAGRDRRSGRWRGLAPACRRA